MKTKAKKKTKKAVRKTVRDESALKAFGRLEEISKGLVPKAEGKDIEPFDLLVRATPGGRQAESKNELVIKVVKIIDDRREAVLKEIEQDADDEKD
jgi:hypothetical protein